jgi:hypothetical protein
MAALKRMKAAVVETFGGPVKRILPFTPDNCADYASTLLPSTLTLVVTVPITIAISR